VAENSTSLTRKETDERNLIWIACAQLPYESPVRKKTFDFFATNHTTAAANTERCPPNVRGYRYPSAARCRGAQKYQPSVAAQEQTTNAAEGSRKRRNEEEAAAPEHHADVYEFLLSTHRAQTQNSQSVNFRRERVRPHYKRACRHEICRSAYSVVFRREERPILRIRRPL